ncbi:MAG: hypothetical protein P8J33_11895, partial [Pirellulaceae bacterium]|nr:hypothetical protein [Pirellulaceae bacterium]
QEAKDQRDSFQAQYLKASKESNGYQAQAGIYMAMLGVEDIAVNEIETYKSDLAASNLQEMVNQTLRVEETWNADMAKLASGEGGADRTYRKLVEDFSNAIADQHANTTVLTNTVKETKQKLETEITTKNKQLEEKDVQLAKAQTDLSSEQERHEKTRIELNQRLDDTQSQFQKVNRELQDTESDLANKTADFKRNLDAAKATIIKKESTITSLTAKETNVADGQVVNVAPRLGKVTLNLGYDDNLQLKQTFAIYDQSASKFKSGYGKAMIEVTRILDAHLAEGRITSQNINHPILTKDWVVTSTWDPGYSVPIAIAGFIDLDGDGRSDLQRLISIVEGVGYGKVVAYHDDDGKVIGEIDENTRFFVKGDDPLGNAVDGYRKLEQDRERFQTREISVQEFLHEMGYRNEARVRRFSENLSEDRFKARQPGGTQVDSGSPFGSGN